jgi:hypothetical protein
VKSANQLVWLFGCGEQDAAKTRVVRFWAFCLARAEVQPYLVLQRSAENMRFVQSLDCGHREHAVFAGSREHRVIVQHVDLAVVGARLEDAFTNLSRPAVMPPLVVFPDQEAEPENEICGDSADNALFRYVAKDEACACYLKMAKGLSPYQIVLDAGLYAEGERWEHAAKQFLDSLLFAQSHRFIFMGFALTHVGGTPMATHALAEGLLEKGCQVTYVTLRRTIKVSTPVGIPIVSIEGLARRSSLLLKCFRMLLPKKAQQLDLQYDPGSFDPACGQILRGALHRIRCDYAVSTRDSLHAFLSRDVRLPNTRKVYFFHCPSLWWKRFFGHGTEIIKHLLIEKAVFVTEANRQALARDHGLTNYNEHLVLGNGLSSLRMIEREQVVAPTVSNCIRVCWPVRIEEGRKAELEDCLSFGKFLQEQAVRDIQIDVYGTGDYAKKFAAEIAAHGLGGVIFYRGNSEDIRATYAQYDAVVDFTRMQSFGMVYIEAVLNGKMIFCYRNEGSSEVLKDIPDAYFDNYTELLSKLQDLRTLSREQLQTNYDLIASRFSRQAIAEKFLGFLKAN